MRPVLNPALRRVWRDAETLQIGLDPDRAVVLTGLDPHLAQVVGSLTGRRTTEGILTHAVARGASRAATHRLLRLLTTSGVLDDATTTAALDQVGRAERERLEPDLAAHSVTGGRTDGGAAGLLRRRATHVAIHGAGRIGASVASLVAAAGVGRVSIIDPAPARPADLAPAGLTTADLGVARADGACRVAAEAGPSTDVTTVRHGQLVERPDLAVLAPDDEPDRRLADMLVRAGIPHLVVRMREGRAILGPFVVPGESSCVRCHDLHRTARDPQWPRLLDQLLSSPPPPPASDIALVTSVAATAVLHLLAFVDGTKPPSVDGTVEMLLPFGTSRRRSWPPHPACGCRWDPTPPTAEPASNPPRSGQTARFADGRPHDAGAPTDG